MDAILDYFRQLSWWETFLFSFGIFVASFVGSLAVSIWVLVKLPADYFVNGIAEEWWPDQHPVLRVLFHLGKNVLGILLIALGVVLSLPGVPGQGILTILIGLMLLDFPGKRRLERAIVRRQGVRNTINRIRARFDRPPLVIDLPEKEKAESSARPPA
ncbi:MAG: hypothetical protein AB7K24_22080 [Gemmataceae bacterium]